MALKYLSDDASSAHPVSEISDNLGIPFDSTSHVLQSLAKHSIVAAHAGVHGGYSIVKPLGELTLLELRSIVEKKVPYSSCDELNCSYEVNCNIKVPFQNLQKRITDFYQTITVGELLSEEIA